MLKQLNYQGDALEPAPAPDIMPLLAITSQKTLWQSVDLGQLSVETERIANGIAFKRIWNWRGRIKNLTCQATGKLMVRNLKPVYKVI